MSAPDDLARAFTPFRLGGLTLRNRVIKTATYEGMTPRGVPSDALLAHHRELAAGGVGMTTVAYCAVSPDGRTFGDQLWLSDAALPPLRRLVEAVHAEGAAASLQLGHCGGFSKNTAVSGGAAKGPSAGINEYGFMSGMFRVQAMSEAEIAGVVADFARAAATARSVGFDAVELHLGHGYLLSQFLSPVFNRRRDRFGGSLDGRARLPVEVVRAVREAVGPAFPVLAKINLSDGVRRGVDLDDAVEVARRLEWEGVDALVLSGGLVSKTPFYLLRGDRPLRAMIDVDDNPLQKVALAVLGPLRVRPYPFEEMFFLDQARRVRGAVTMPLALLGGVVSTENLATAMREGFELVAMGRALIADPDLVAAMREGRKQRTRCTHCNLCVVEMDRGGVRCVL